MRKTRISWGNSWEKIECLVIEMERTRRMSGVKQVKLERFSDGLCGSYEGEERSRIC